ncbi:unnamed protein product [Schistosoma turkestanicum]|nr:unnamed protein product [Schistosoma turkestanicum]
MYTSSSLFFLLLLSRYDLNYGCSISRRKCCDLIPHYLPATAFNPGHNLTRRFQQQSSYWPNVKWFFFITSNGLHTEYPAHNFQCTTTTIQQNTDYAMNIQSYSDTTINYISSSSSMSIPSPYNSMKSKFYPYTMNSFASAAYLYHCHNLHQFRHRDVFIRSILPKPIWMIIVLDQGEASQTQLLLGQRVAHLLLMSLSEKDYINVLLVSDNVSHGLSTVENNNPTQLNLSIPSEILNNNSSENLFNNNLQWNNESSYGIAHKATEEMKLYLDQFIHSINRPLPIKTNHIKAFKHAFQTIVSNLKHFRNKNLLSDDIPEHIMLAYISRGYLTDLTEASTTLLIVSYYQNVYLNNSVYINTYMPIEEKSTTVLFEQKFMKDLATRWSAYSTTRTSSSSSSQFNQHFPPKIGHFFPINRTTDLSDTVGRFYEIFLNSSSSSSSSSSFKTNVNHSKETTSKSSNTFLTPTNLSFSSDDATVEIENNSIDPTSTTTHTTTTTTKSPSDVTQSNTVKSLFDHVKTQPPNDELLFPVQYSLPYYDLEGGDLIMTISQAFVDQDKFIGVMGIDVHLLDLVDNLLHFSSDTINGGAGSTIAFLVQTPDGYTLSHPALSDTLLKHSHHQAHYINNHNPKSINTNTYAMKTLQPWKHHYVDDVTMNHTAPIHHHKPSWIINSPSDSSTIGRCTKNCEFLPRVGNFHRSLPQQRQHQSILNPDISKLEWIPGFHSLVRNRILNEFTGEINLLITLVRCQFLIVLKLTF